MWNFCSHLQYFRVNCLIQIDLKFLIQFILRKINQDITQLRILSIKRVNPNVELLKDVRTILDQLSFAFNYTITCKEEHTICIHLQ